MTSQRLVEELCTAVPLQLAVHVSRCVTLWLRGAWPGYLTGSHHCRGIGVPPIV